MASDNNSIFGPLTPVLVPANLANDAYKIGQALLAWDYHLNSEQVRLLELIAAGLSNDQIAEKLDVSQEKTAKSRIQELYKRLRVTTRSQASGIAARYGLTCWKKEGIPE